MYPLKPETKYTKSGDVNIAYQVFGSGPIDLVYIPAWVSNIDWMWACPELVHFLNRLGQIARVILFDKRGTGLSDRVAELATTEERMDDIRAVMDAVNSEKAVLFGHSEGGAISALFAATYPNRTIALIAFGIFAKRIFTPDYPWAPTNQEHQVVYDMIEKSWCGEEMDLKSLAPSKANDKVFMNWLANYFRSGASPSAALKLAKMNNQVDIVDILGTIKVPALLLQRRSDFDVKIEEGRFIAERIEDAKFVEFEGSDHLFWTGSTEEVLEEMEAFVLNLKPKSTYEKQLFTIIVGRIVSSEVNNHEHQALLRKYVEQYGGNIVQYETQLFTITFDGPSKAVNCSINLVDAIKNLNAQLVIGIQIKECSIENYIRNNTDGFASLVFNQSGSSQILITQTVKNLLVDAGLDFVPSKLIFESEYGTSHLLFLVTKQLKTNTLKNNSDSDSFLNKVLRNIHDNMSNEHFSVEMLCKEIGVSERQVQRKLKTISHKSPNQLICSIRLNRAKELILTKQDTIAEIAFQTGFSNPSYFSKCFKKEFAVSPSELLNFQQ